MLQIYRPPHPCVVECKSVTLPSPCSWTLDMRVFSNTHFQPKACSTLKRNQRTCQQQNNISNVKNRISSSQNAAYKLGSICPNLEMFWVVKICQPIDKQAPECYSLCSRCDTTTQPSLLFARPPGSYLCFYLQAAQSVISPMQRYLSNKAESASAITTNHVKPLITIKKYNRFISS
jgi:hypothetical protein